MMQMRRRRCRTRLRSWTGAAVGTLIGFLISPVGVDVAAIVAAFGDGIGEKVERRSRALESVFRRFVAGTHVGMQFFGQRPVGATNFVGAGGSADAEGGIRVPVQGVRRAPAFRDK